MLLTQCKTIIRSGLNVFISNFEYIELFHKNNKKVTPYFVKPTCFLFIPENKINNKFLKLTLAVFEKN